MRKNPGEKQEKKPRRKTGKAVVLLKWSWLEKLLVVTLSHGGRESSFVLAEQSNSYVANLLVLTLFHCGEPSFVNNQILTLQWITLPCMPMFFTSNN